MGNKSNSDDQTSGLPSVEEMFGDDGSDLDTSGDRGDSLESATSTNDDGEGELTVDPNAGDGEGDGETQTAEGGEGETQTAEGGEAETQTAEGGEGETQTDEGGEADTNNDQRIPKSRFDEVNERRKDAERRLAEMQKQQQGETQGETQPEIDFDFNAKEDEYQDAVLEGDKDKAKNIRAEIREAEGRLYEQRAQKNAKQTVEQSSEQQKLRTQIVEAQAEYPELDSNDNNFNQEANNEAMDLFESYKARGYAPSEAMSRAVDRTSRLYGLTPLSKRGEPQQEQQEQNQPSDKPSQQDVDKKTQTANKQPPQPQTRSQEDTTPDIMSMSEEEFDNLPDAEKAKLRGDA